MIEIKENTNNAEEFNYLYDRVQWGAYDIETTKKLLNYIQYQYMMIIKLLDMED